MNSRNFEYKSREGLIICSLDIIFFASEKKERGPKGIVYGCSIMELMMSSSPSYRMKIKINKLFVIFSKQDISQYFPRNYQFFKNVWKILQTIG